MGLSKGSIHTEHSRQEFRLRKSQANRPQTRRRGEETEFSPRRRGGAEKKERELEFHCFSNGAKRKAIRRLPCPTRMDT